MSKYNRNNYNKKSDPDREPNRFWLFADTSLAVLLGAVVAIATLVAWLIKGRGK